MVNDFRYQPVPKIGSAPVCGFNFESNGPSIAQSCGRLTWRHWESLKSGRSAPSAAPLKNRQSASKLTRRSPEIGIAAGAAQAVRIAGSAGRHRAAIRTPRLLNMLGHLPNVAAPFRPAQVSAILGRYLRWRFSHAIPDEEIEIELGA